MRIPHPAGRRRAGKLHGGNQGNFGMVSAEGAHLCKRPGAGRSRGGAIIAAPLIVWMMLRFGWRSAFVITGALGFLWLIAWLFFYHLPEKHPRITTAELSLIQTARGPGRDAVRIRWIDLLKYPQSWGLLLARFISDPVWWFYLGSVSGIVACGSGLGGALFTNLTGQLVESFSYNAIFIIMGFLHHWDS